ncbi:MAG: hypothetical protein KGJ86_07950 [Chloroflexota bacterium]|nr:hypothetical protein [Chloroflexota bacterium]
MPESGIDRMKDIARRFYAGELSLHDAALEAGMTEERFQQVVRSYAWMEQKAGQAARAAGGAARLGQRLFNRWTGGK